MRPHSPLLCPSLCKPWRLHGNGRRAKRVVPDGTTPEWLGCSAKTYATPWLALSMAVLVEFTAVSIASATSPPLKTD